MIHFFQINMMCFDPNRAFFGCTNQIKLDNCSTCHTCCVNEPLFFHLRGVHICCRLKLMGHATDFPIVTMKGLNNEAEYIVFSFVARVSVSDMYEEIHTYQCVRSFV